jgi:hypothetical protein
VKFVFVPSTRHDLESGATDVGKGVASHPRDTSRTNASRGWTPRDATGALSARERLVKPRVSPRTPSESRAFYANALDRRLTLSFVSLDSSFASRGSVRARRARVVRRRVRRDGHRARESRPRALRQERAGAAPADGAEDPQVHFAQGGDRKSYERRRPRFYNRPRRGVADDERRRRHGRVREIRGATVVAEQRQRRGESHGSVTAERDLRGVLARGHEPSAIRRARVGAQPVVQRADQRHHRDRVHRGRARDGQPRVVDVAQARSTRRAC